MHQKFVAMLRQNKYQIIEVVSRNFAIFRTLFRRIHLNYDNKFICINLFTISINIFDVLLMKGTDEIDFFIRYSFNMKIIAFHEKTNNCIAYLLF